MKQQTAVEWLIENLPNLSHKIGHGLAFEIHAKLQKAKEIEKEQIINAWMATDNELQRIAAEQYYNETYGKQ